MGSSFNLVHFRLGEFVTHEQVKKEFAARQEQDRREHGSSYSGSIGMADGISFTGKRFGSHADARRWLEENAQPWGPALCVQVREDTGEYWLAGAWCSE